MDTLTVSKRELKIAVRKSVREVLAQELMKLRATLVAFISEKEQRDIEKLYGKPSRKTVKSRTIELL